MTRVLCAGNLSVDFIFRVLRFPAKHEKFVAKDFYVGLGGAPRAMLQNILLF